MDFLRHRIHDSCPGVWAHAGDRGDAGSRCEAGQVEALGSFAVGRGQGVVGIWLRQCCLGQTRIMPVDLRDCHGDDVGRLGGFAAFLSRRARVVLGGRGTAVGTRGRERHPADEFWIPFAKEGAGSESVETGAASPYDDDKFHLPGT